MSNLKQFFEDFDIPYETTAQPGYNMVTNAEMEEFDKEITEAVKKLTKIPGWDIRLVSSMVSLLWNDSERRAFIDLYNIKDTKDKPYLASIIKNNRSEEEMIIEFCKHYNEAPNPIFNRAAGIIFSGLSSNRLKKDLMETIPLHRKTQERIIASFSPLDENDEKWFSDWKAENKYSSNMTLKELKKYYSNQNDYGEVGYSKDKLSTKRIFELINQPSTMMEKRYEVFDSWEGNGLSKRVDSFECLDIKTRNLIREMNQKRLEPDNKKETKRASDGQPNTIPVNVLNTKERGELLKRLGEGEQALSYREVLLKEYERRLQQVEPNTKNTYKYKD